MPNTTIRVLRTDTPGNSLAIWLGYHHPDLFLAAYRQARAAQGTKAVKMGWLRNLGRLAQDDSFLPGLTPYSGDTSAPTDLFSTSPPGADLPEPDLQNVTVDSESISALPTNLISDSAGDIGSSSVLGAIGTNTTSAGTTLSSVMGGASGVLSALGSVGNFVTSPVGLKSLAGLATSYFASQAASTNQQTQQAVLNTQIARAATNQAAAPIRYTTNAAGQLVPVYATAAGAIPLTSQGLASLTPSSLSVFFAQNAVLLLLMAGVLAVAVSRR